MESSIRRYQNYLATSGRAVIFFSICSFLRIAMYFLAHPTMITEWVERSGFDASFLKIALIAFGFFFLLEFCIIISVNTYIGRCAIRESRGGKGGRLYLILSALYLLFSIIAAYPELTAEDIFSGGASLGTGLIVDVTCDYAHGCLLYSVCRLRRLTREKK